MSNSIYENIEKAVKSSDLTLIQVLYVDDEAGLLEVFKQIMEVQGSFHVETASSVEEARKKMAKKGYDVIVSDYQMPGQSGLDFLEYLRAKGERIPFILFTGKGREEVAIKALNLGADHYINKIGKAEVVFGELQHSIQQLSEKKKAEKKLKILSEVVEQSSNSIAVMDRNGKIVYANKKLLEPYGVNYEELVGMSFGSWLQADSVMKEKMRDIALMIHRHKKGWSGEISKVLDNGEVIWRNAKVFPLFKENGDFSYIAYVGEDITKQKKTEKELLKKNEIWRTLCENTSDLIFLIDSKYNVLTLNCSAVRFLGRNYDDFLGKSITKFFPREVAIDFERILKHTFDTGRGKIYESSLIMGNKRFWLSTNISPIMDDEGKVVAVMGISRNITESKQMEQALAESEEKYRNLVELSPDGIATMNMKGIITSVNKSFLKWTGFSRDEIEGKHISKLGTIKNIAELPKYLKIATSVLRGKMPEPFEFPYFTKGRTKRWGEAHLSLLEKDGRKIGALAVLRDVTERKRTVEKIERMNEKLAVIGRLTRHDTRNVLSSVLNKGYIIKQAIPKNEHVSKYYEDVESAFNRIERIFEFAKIYEMLGSQELVYIDLGNSFNEAFCLLPELQGFKIINGCKGVTVFADSLLRQLFYNLLDNSLRYGEKVSQIKLYYKVERNKLKVIYEDNGVGIGKSEKKKVFDEGYGKGTGFGLYLIRKICEVYGWTIQETGKKGKGAQFTIAIPKTKINEKDSYQIQK